MQIGTSQVAQLTIAAIAVLFVLKLLVSNLRRKEVQWIATNGEIPGGHCLSCGFLGLFEPRLKRTY